MFVKPAYALLGMALLGLGHVSAQQSPVSEQRYGYRGLVLGETTPTEAETAIGEILACVAIHRDATPTREITCQAAARLASPQLPWLYFLDGKLRGVHILMPRDKTLEIVSAQVAAIFPGPGQSIVLPDGRRVWRSRGGPVMAVVSEVKVRLGDPLRLAVVLSDRRVPWP